MNIYKSENRGKAEFGWLSARFSFSFGHFYDPQRISYGPLRVLNNDIIQPKTGFDFHPHSNMEIVTIILNGELTHEDSMGNAETIKKGDVQAMTAGTGIVHSEKNNSNKETELFQLWFLPDKQNLKPSYSDLTTNWFNSKNEWNCLISPKLTPLKNSLQINQDVFISIGNFNSNTDYQTYVENRSIYLMLIAGKIKINGEILEPKDAISIDKVDKIKIKTIDPSSIMVIEMKNTD